MNKYALIIPAFILSLGSGFAQGIESEGRATLTATLTTASPRVSVPAGTQSRLKTQRFGNREVLQLLVEDSLIDTIKGYTLVQRFDQDGQSIGFFAVNAKEGDEVEIPLDILSTSVDVVVEAGNENLVTGNVNLTAKIHSTMLLDDTSIALVETVTRNTLIDRSQGFPEQYIGISRRGVIQGSILGDLLDNDSTIIEARLTVARSKAIPLPPL
jgi:hypothetical protein